MKILKSHVPNETVDSSSILFQANIFQVSLQNTKKSKQLIGRIDQSISSELAKKSTLKGGPLFGKLGCLERSIPFGVKFLLFPIFRLIPVLIYFIFRAKMMTKFKLFLHLTLM